jgi:MFS family permease
MKSQLPIIQALAVISPDGRLLFATRILRMFAYGLLSVILVLYLSSIGLSEQRIGILLTLTLIGDTAISLWLTTVADRVGRKRMLLIGAGLMMVASLVFALTDNFLLLLIAAAAGIISPSGNEVGPFLSIEQAGLSQTLPDEQRTAVFAWYNLVGSFSTAIGALISGMIVSLLHGRDFSVIQSYRVIVISYGLVGLVLAALFIKLSKAIEIDTSNHDYRSPDQPRIILGLHRSRGVIMKLASLFAMDAFAGGFVIQSIVAYWFHVRFGIEAGLLGTIFFGSNLLAGVSALLAARLAAKFGLINTMVFTHIPSNLLLILVPIMPNLPLAIAILLARFSISQMDVPTRQSYTMAVVKPDERSAAAGVTNVARTTGASLGPIFTGPLLANPVLMNTPFFIAGGIKLIYDLLLYRSFRKLNPPEESAPKREAYNGSSSISIRP